MIAEALEPHRYTTFPAEREILRWLLATYDPGAWCGQYTTVVEIGAFEGETSAFLAQHKGGGRPMVVIDPWDGTQDAAGDAVYARFLARMRPWLTASTVHLPDRPPLVNPSVQVWRQRSQTVTPPPNLGFVFHDGDHRHPDFQPWWDALVPGGVLVIHDALEPGWPRVGEAARALGRPWHEYRYVATPEVHAEYGPAVRGLFWKVKA